MGLCGLLHPLPLPTRRGGVIGVDWLLGLLMTASGFDQVQVHVDHLLGKVHAVPTRSTDTAADAAQIILKMALRSGDGLPDVLVVDHNPKFTSALFKEFTRHIGSSLLIGSVYCKNTNAKAERVNGVLGDTLCAFANGRKDDWDVWLPYAVFAINNTASTLGGDLSPFLIDSCQHQRLPLSLQDLLAAGEPLAAHAARMKALEQEVVALLHTAQQEHKAALDLGRGLYCLPGGLPGDASHQGAAGCGGGRQASSAMGGPIHGGGPCWPEHLHLDPPEALQVQSHCECRPSQALLLPCGPASNPRPCHGPGAGGGVRGGAAPQLQDPSWQDLLLGTVAGACVG